MKKTMTKKFFTFILLMSGMFSFTVADAQLTCPAGKIPIFHCYSDRHYEPHCRDRCANPNNIPNGWYSGDCFSYGCGARLANEPAGGELFMLAVSPNPVSGSSVIYFFLEQSENVSLKMFDVNGRLVSTLADKIFNAGENELVWNAGEVNAGIYFLRMETASYSENRKLIVAK